MGDRLLWIPDPTACGCEVKVGMGGTLWVSEEEAHPVTVTKIVSRGCVHVVLDKAHYVLLTDSWKYRPNPDGHPIRVKVRPDHNKINRWLSDTYCKVTFGVRERVVPQIKNSEEG